MAIVRTAGTEIIRSAHFEVVDSTEQILIVGVQHHIYTVLSVIVFSYDQEVNGNYMQLFIQGYDSKEGTTDEELIIFRQPMSDKETFVWNDKFSFNGYEPTDFAGPMNDATKQDAIADQGSGVAQTLVVKSEHADDNFDVHVTFIDQNNS